MLVLAHFASNIHVARLGLFLMGQTSQHLSKTPMVMMMMMMMV